MWNKIISWTIVLFSVFSLNAQTFTYSGYIRNADGTGAVNVPVKLYKRTTPVMNGFTSQNNYNGHSYYRSTGSMFWTDARQACLNMGGHLVTVTTAAENSFIFGLWPSGKFLNKKSLSDLAEKFFASFGSTNNSMKV